MLNVFSLPGKGPADGLCGPFQFLPPVTLTLELRRSGRKRMVMMVITRL